MEEEKEVPQITPEQENEHRRVLSSAISKLTKTANKSIVQPKLNSREAYVLLQYINYMNSALANINEQMKKDSEN